MQVTEQQFKDGLFQHRHPLDITYIDKSNKSGSVILRVWFVKKTGEILGTIMNWHKYFLKMNNPDK